MPIQKSLAAIAACAALLCYMAANQNSSKDRIRVIPNETERRVDIVIDGRPFTSYIWPEKLAKPVLYPLRTAKGTIVTRSFPLEPPPAERVDHPHHVGLRFNYGNATAFDFWNISQTIKVEDAPKIANI